MPFKLFGFQFDFNQKSTGNSSIQSIRPTGTALSPVPPENQEGAINIAYGGGGGHYGYYLDLDGAVVDDFSLINRYRDMQFVAEVDEAIDQIINEVVIQDAGRMPVSLDLDYVDSLDEKLKIRIQAEFDSLLKQMNFHKDAYSLVREWYVDGRLYYYIIVDEASPERGILELRKVDPRTIRKIREVTRKRHEETQMDIVEVQREYYVYNPVGMTTAPGQQQPTGGAGAAMLQYNGTKIASDSIAFVPSGLYDQNKKTVLSWLHKAIKPLNLMRMMEDACVIYRIARAPERRVFYIDVGNLPKNKAEEYLNATMAKYRNKLVYDVNSGEMRDDRKFMSIMEDFWLPRREGGKGTEITTLPAGQNLSEMEDVDYFRRKLYRALNLPPSRVDQGTGLSVGTGRSTEISRDELRFNKFVHRLQVQFSTLFDQLLEKQLRLKNILSERDWYRIKDNIRYTWQTDSYFEELKSQDMWTSRLNLVALVDPYLNKYFSEDWVSREVLKFTEDERASMREEFAEQGIPGLPGEAKSEFGDEGEDTFGVGQGSEEAEDFDAQADALLGDEDDLNLDDDGKELNDEDDDVEFNPDAEADTEDDEDPFDKELKDAAGDDSEDDEDDDEVDIDADTDDDGDEDEDDVAKAAKKIAANKDKSDDADDEGKPKKKGNPFGNK